MFDRAGEGPAGEGGLPSGDQLAAYEASADEHGLAGIAHLEGCAELAGWLASVDPGQVGEFDLVEVVAGFERVAAWAKARAAAAAAELAARPLMNPVPAAPRTSASVSVPCLAGTELSLRLGISPYAAGKLLDTGRALTGVLQATGAALDAGSIDWVKATVIVDALKDVPWQVAHLVEEAVLPDAPLRSHSQLRRDVARALAEVDPRDAQERHTRAAGSRRVEHPRTLPDGMASMRAILPAAAAVRLDATLHSAARSAKSSGDPRTMDQLRADALDAMAGAAWDTGWIGACPGADACSPQTACADGDADADADSAADRDGASSSGLDDDPSVPRAELTSAGAVWSGGAPEAGTVAPSDHERFRVGRVDGRRAQIRVTVGYGTLIGLDERPAELEGYGPIGADVARRIAAQGTWRRLLVEPASGAVLDVGRTRYKPPPDLVEHVLARNPSCFVPTCSVPATRCDLDHTVPFGAGGSTAAHNTGPGCRHHHREKTHGGLPVTQPSPGHFHVRTLTAHHYDEFPTRPPGVPLPADTKAPPRRRGSPLPAQHLPPGQLSGPSATTTTRSPAVATTRSSGATTRGGRLSGAACR